MLKETQAMELHSAVDQLKTKLVKVSKDKGQLEAENAHLMSKLGEVEATAEQIEASARHSVDKLSQSLQKKYTLLKMSKSENDKLKVGIFLCKYLSHQKSNATQIGTFCKVFANLVAASIQIKFALARVWHCFALLCCVFAIWWFA